LTNELLVAQKLSSLRVNIHVINLMNQINDLQHNNKLKTIVLSEENYDKLKRLGSFGESFNDVLSRLLEMETGQNTKHWSEK